MTQRPKQRRREKDQAWERREPDLCVCSACGQEYDHLPFYQELVCTDCYVRQLAEELTPATRRAA
jgi:DNA-directed RNA polymerase subunit RPC12/RpoP